MQRPHEWLDGRTLGQIAGAYAWRSRVSDCRIELGMTIENRKRVVTDEHGQRWTVSEYCYRPPADPVISAEPWELRA